MSRPTGPAVDVVPCTIAPGDALIVVVSCEGPDAYSQAGGLGVRITGLVETLAGLDYETHLFFIGDPALPGEERATDGRLVLHRWAQWISADCPGGVYDGEARKVNDLTTWLPQHVVDGLIVPAIGAGRTPILLFEEWQTVDCAIRIAEALTARGIRDRAILVWNANNPYGFDRIDWMRLASATTITTISRHMRSIVRAKGVDARIIPNGLSEQSFQSVSADEVSHLRSAVAGRAGGLLFKMARWEREKGWTQALDAMARLRASESTRDAAPVLIARSGGPNGQGDSLMNEAWARGLRVASFDDEREFLTGLGACVGAGADVISLQFGVSHDLARRLFAAVDGVLANSVSEPFGLVGLETMAAGGVAITGGTGEDYAVDRRNAVVLQTLNPGEIVVRWRELASRPELSARMRRLARKTARDYTWRNVVGMLIETITLHGGMSPGRTFGRV